MSFSTSMFIVPIVERALPNSGVKQAWILLERNGGHLISVDSEEGAAAFAAENGLTVHKAWKDGDCVFQSVVPTANLAEFYTWAETPPGQQPMREVWRPFLVCGGADTLGLLAPLKEISVGPAHTVGGILETFFKGAQV